MGKKRLFAGVDIGGTKLHAVVADEDGEILGRARKKAKGHKGFESVMERVVACLEKACQKSGVEIADLDSVGVGAPSPVSADGMAVNAPNMGWRDVPLVKTLQNMLDVAVVAENDCNLGTFGEYAFGAGVGSESLVGLFVGTGLGGGIVHRGEIVRGNNHLAAEVGHMVVQVGGRRCGCGHLGCLEAYASKTGMAHTLRRTIEEEGRASILNDEDVDLGNVRASMLAQAWEGGDEVACEALRELCAYLGVGVANMVTLFGPSAVLLGGGVFEALGAQLIDAVRSAAKEVVFPAASYDDVRIDLSTLGDDAVALGAVAYARETVPE